MLLLQTLQRFAGMQAKLTTISQFQPLFCMQGEVMHVVSAFAPS
jgi:hypothetical protein